MLIRHPNLRSYEDLLVCSCPLSSMYCQGRVLSFCTARALWKHHHEAGSTAVRDLSAAKQVYENVLQSTF